MGQTIASVVSAGLMIAGAVVTGGLGVALIAAGVAVQFAASQMYKPKMPGMGRDQAERKQMLRSSTASETVIVGRTVVSGLLFFAEEEPGEQDEHEKITLAIALAGHPIEKIGRIWLGDDQIESFGEHAEWALHNGRTDADPFMLENCPSWKPDMIGREMAWLRVTLKFDTEKFPYGLPNIKCEVWGKKLYDPRTQKTAWSNNGALVILDYYRSYLQVPDADIDWGAFKRAADICDESIGTPDGGRESRYTLNGAYELEESPASILDAMHRCVAADPTYMAGKHGMLAGAYYGPAVLEIHENQITDTVTLTPEVGLKEATNAIYGTFVDAEQIHTKTDFTPVIRHEWIAEDGLEIKENLDFRFVTTPYQAQRLALQYLRRKRAGRRVQLKMNLDGYAYRPGQVVRLNLPTLGIGELEFRVIDWRFSALDGADLTLEEDGAYVYEDAISKPFERPPFTRLPAGSVGSPTTLTFIPQTLGDVIQGVLSWRNVNEVAFNRVTIYQDTRIVQTIQVPGESVNLAGLVRGNYRAEVRAVNAAGAMSAPAVFEFSIQAPPPPVNVEITPGFFSLTVVPRQGDVASFGHTFEFWFSEKQLDHTHEPAVINHADRLGQGNFWLKDHLRAGTTYWFYIRTLNTYGKSLFVEASGIPDSNTKAIMDELEHDFMTTEAGKRLERQIDFTTEAIMENAALMGSVVQHQLKENGEMRAEILEVRTTQITDQKAFAEKMEKVQVNVGENAAAIEERAIAVFNVDGNGYAIKDIGAGVWYNGQFYKAGVVIGAEVKNGKVETHFGVRANQFTVVNPTNEKSEPVFVIKNGQVLANSLLVGDATITSAKIADTLQSTNFNPSRRTGFRLNMRTGEMVSYGQGNSGYWVETNNLKQLFDNNGRLRIRMGFW
ncbi:phage tail tip fiber protein [Xenorhabdus sp. Sc-CR9]|uniref:phage tail tip fiber protein n=1 Tax=Xenorhabdus sp. Sc-CR9 TaxID=2584468 RepID=UPI001F1B97E7|nr:DUF1983 domain-containing protein [Xenorhabdus sp. Sc-CR9]